MAGSATIPHVAGRALALLALVGGLLGALSFMPQSYNGYSFEFLTPDSFYHGVRILHASEPGNTLVEFDDLANVPDGMLVSWPWLYDQLMAWMLQAAQFFANDIDPGFVLGLVPALTLLLNGGLLIAIGRLCGLGPVASAAAGLIYCLMPAVQYVHAFGRIDHHFLEVTGILLSLFASLHWFRRATERTAAVFAGVSFALAMAFHSALFILQIPLLLGLVRLWFSGEAVHYRATAIPFAVTLLLTTLLLLAPSLPFRNFDFTYYNFGWFQLYASACTAVFVIALTRYPFRAATLAGLGVLAMVLASPLLGEVIKAREFMLADIPHFSNILEVRAPAWFLEREGMGYFLRRFTPVVLLLPLLVPGVLYLWLRPARRGDGVLAGFALIGLLLFVVQFRFEYFASYTMALLPVLLLSRAGTALHTVPARSKQVIGIALLAGWAAWTVPLTKDYYRHNLSTQKLTISVTYHHTRAIFDVIRDTCEKKPGVLLADWQDGHFIRYHSRCAVVATPMVISPEHVAGVLRVRDMLGQDPQSLREKYPWVDYVYVVNTERLDPSLRTVSNNQALVNALLSDRRFPGFQQLFELNALQKDGRKLPFARFFRIRHESSDTRPVSR